MENIKFKERFIDEKTGIEYIRVGDYYYESNKVLGNPQAIFDCVSGSGSYMPNIVLSGTEKDIKLGKYGRMRLRYLKEHRKAKYTILLMKNKLQKHLLDVDKTAYERLHLLMKQLAERENITEELKANNQMEWVRLMNNIKHFKF